MTPRAGSSPNVFCLPINWFYFINTVRYMKNKGRTLKYALFKICIQLSTYIYNKFPGHAKSEIVQ